MYGALLVLKMVLCGCVAVMAWDVFAALRQSLGIKGVPGGVIDFLSPAAFGAVIWWGVLCIAHGGTRVYEFLCMGMGIILYIFTVKILIFRLFCTVFVNIFKFIRFIFKILLTPARFLYKMIYVILCSKKRTTAAETEKI